MADRTKKENLGELEKRISAGEQAVRFEPGGEKIPEQKETSPDERAVADELRKEIEMMEVVPELLEEAKKKAEKIQFLGEEEKIEHLLSIAHEKGIVSAIKTAKAMKDPYILDVLHDILAKGGYYKNFEK